MYSLCHGERRSDNSPTLILARFFPPFAAEGERGGFLLSPAKVLNYCIFLQREFPEKLTYDIGTHHEGDGSLISFALGQIGGKRNVGTASRPFGNDLLIFRG